MLGALNGAVAVGKTDLLRLKMCIENVGKLNGDGARWNVVVVLEESKCEPL